MIKYLKYNIKNIKQITSSRSKREEDAAIRKVLSCIEASAREGFNSCQCYIYGTKHTDKIEQVLQSLGYMDYEFSSMFGAEKTLNIKW